MFVGGVVIDDGVDGLSLRHLRLDGIEEADELLMALALHVVADDGAVEHVESGERRGGAVPFVVVRHCTGAARLHRQARLRAIKRLDLALFIDREDDRMLRRVDIEADNVLEFIRKLRIVRQLERADAMRGELVSLQNPLHRSQAHAGRLRQHPACPMRCFSRRRPKCQIDHPLHERGRQRRLAGFAGLVAGQAGNALLHKALLPAPHHRLGLVGSPHDLGRAAAIGGGEDDFGAPNMLLRRVAIADNRLKLTAILRRDVHDNSCSHNENLNCFGNFGNRSNESDH